MLKLILSITILFTASLIIAQVPTDQDCLGAIPVCQDIYLQPNSYQGTGNYPNEIPTSGSCPGNCLLSGEKNDVWYIFTVQVGGLLSFNITPYNNSDDYDWAVYSLNEYKCEDIYAHTSEMQVSCNYSGTAGVTGPNGNSNSSCQPAGGTPHNAKIPVEAGDTYVINISNYSSTQNGYVLDFTTSTAEIYDDVAPELDEVQNDFLQCGLTELTVDFTEKVLCSSVQPGDFILDGPGGPYDVTEVFGQTCDVGGEMENTFTLTFTPPIYASGDYTLSLVALNFIQDLCGNNASSQTLEFTLNLDSPEADAGEDIEIPFLTSTQLDGYVEGGSGDYSYSWTPEDKLEDPFVEDPLTVVLSESTEFAMNIVDNTTGCQASDQVMVSIVGGEMSLITSADPPELCAASKSDLSALTSGGSGEYTYSWSSDPPGFSSDIPNPSVFPLVTTTYFVEVSDGYSTINDQVTIVVFPSPIADAGPDQVITIGSSTILNGNASEGTAPYSFDWEPVSMINGPNDIQNPETIILGAPQNYTLVVTDHNLCESDPSAVLINATGEALAAYPQADPPEICFGGSTIINANATGGTETYTYKWTNNIPGWEKTGEIIEVEPVETTTYFVEVNDGFNSYSTHIIVTVHPLPEVDIMPTGFIQFGQDTIIVCVRDTVLLDAGNENNPPGMQYLWSNSWADRYIVAKTNGNWFDIQNYLVTVIDPITTCANKDSITILFDFNQCEIGVTEKPLIERPVSIHPNPNQGTIYLKTTEKLNNLAIKVMSMEGGVVLEREFGSINSDDWNIPLDIDFLSKGIYLFSIKADQQVYTLKIVKN